MPPSRTVSCENPVSNIRVSKKTEFSLRLGPTASPAAVPLSDGSNFKAEVNSLSNLMASFSMGRETKDVLKVENLDPIGSESAKTGHVEFGLPEYEFDDCSYSLLPESPLARISRNTGLESDSIQVPLRELPQYQLLADDFPAYEPPSFRVELEDFFQSPDPFVESLIDNLIDVPFVAFSSSPSFAYDSLAGPVRHLRSRSNNAPYLKVKSKDRVEHLFSDLPNWLVEENVEEKTEEAFYFQQDARTALGDESFLYSPEIAFPTGVHRIGRTRYRMEAPYARPKPKSSVTEEIFLTQQVAFPQHIVLPTESVHELAGVIRNKRTRVRIEEPYQRVRSKDQFEVGASVSCLLDDFELDVEMDDPESEQQDIEMGEVDEDVEMFEVDDEMDVSPWWQSPLSYWFALGRATNLHWPWRICCC
ncbi:hypothetical protein C8J56DRAFT_358263 [Mycena floridula]|nr:hypothetical protein C8J56DRAFT_358263 [Mycena floridula]